MRNLLWGLALSLMTAALPATAQTGAAQTDGGKEEAGKKVAPFVPSATRVVDQMLELAKVGPGDYVIDLGAGDGQIVIAAAARGAMGHGVDLDGELVQRSRANANDKGVRDQTAFLQDDIFTTDFSRATVVTLYLMPAANARLRPLLFDRLAPGTRVVSNAFDMREWKSDEYEVGSAGSGIYLWVIPAQVAGEWRFTVDDQPWQLELTQEFQMLTPHLERGGDRLQVDKVLLRGRNLQLITHAGERRYAFHGTVQGDRVEGSVQISDDKGDRVTTWSAERRAKTAAR
jgi:hypothetical protein